MKTLAQIERLISKLNYVFFRIGAFATFCLIVLMLTSVLARYLFQSSYVWFDELLWHIFGLSFLLGSSYTLNQDGHVRVDIFYQKYSPKIKAWVDITGVLFFMIPLCGLLAFHGYFYAESSFQNGEISGSPNGLPYRWIIKSAIPLGFLLLILQSLSHLIKQIFVLADQPEISKDLSSK